MQRLGQEIRPDKNPKEGDGVSQRGWGNMFQESIGDAKSGRAGRCQLAMSAAGIWRQEDMQLALTWRRQDILLQDSKASYYAMPGHLSYPGPTAALQCRLWELGDKNLEGVCRPAYLCITPCDRDISLPILLVFLVV